MDKVDAQELRRLADNMQKMGFASSTEIYAVADEIDRLRAALERILEIKGSTGGASSLVAEYRHIAETALAKAKAGS